MASTLKSMDSKDPATQILLFMRTHMEFDRQVASGVSAYNHQHGRWELVMPVVIPPTRQSLKTYPDARGIIARATNPSTVRLLARTGLPVVLVGDHDQGLPRVGPNDLQVGRMALNCFHAKGLKHVAYCGLPGQVGSDLRERGLTEAAKAQGIRCSVFHGVIFQEMELYRKHTVEEFRRWLVALEKPVGLLVFCDTFASVIQHHCRSLGIAIPEQLLLLGVDNDQLLCELMTPRLSSIDQSSKRIGFEAAAMLDRLLQGKPAPKAAVIVDPADVIERQSTDALAIDHPGVVAALRFIRWHAADGIQVQDVLRNVPYSRRALERAFVSHLGRSVLQEILRTRVEIARHLLSSTDMTLPDISTRCGFSYANKLSTTFKKWTGQSPREFRHKLRIG